MYKNLIKIGNRILKVREMNIDLPQINKMGRGNLCS